MNSVLLVFKKRPMQLAACSRVCIKDSAWTGVYSLSATESIRDADYADDLVLLVYIYIYIYIWIELSVAVKRIYVNNNNCDS